MRNLRSFSSFQRGSWSSSSRSGLRRSACGPIRPDFSLTTLPFLAIMVVMFWDQLRTEWSVDAAVQVFVIGVLAASASLIYNFSSGVVVIDAVYVERYSARATDPNELGVMLGLSVAFAVYLFTKESAGWPWLKWLNVLAIPVGVLSIGLTGSRSSGFGPCSGSGLCHCTGDTTAAGSPIVVAGCSCAWGVVDAGVCPRHDHQPRLRHDGGYLRP